MSSFLVSMSLAHSLGHTLSHLYVVLFALINGTGDDARSLPAIKSLRGVSRTALGASAIYFHHLMQATRATVVYDIFYTLRQGGHSSHKADRASISAIKRARRAAPPWPMVHPEDMPVATGFSVKMGDLFCVLSKSPQQRGRSCDCDFVNDL